MISLFGYIRIAKPELRVKEYEMYKAVYCSLCRKLGKSYGFFSRLTLSYDFTFLAVLNMSLREGCEQIERKRCAFNPIKKCNYCKSDASLEMPTAAAMIMLYYKIKDNIADEKGIKKVGFWLLRPLFSRAHKKAARDFPEIERIVSDYISEQNSLEKSGCGDLDRACEPTAKALARILMLCSDDAVQKRVLERIGYCLGRYIYILDAACDFGEDIKKGSYNVLCLMEKETPKGFDKERVTAQLYFAVNEAARALELLDIKKYKPILNNIIYLGLEDTFKKELNK